LVGFGKLKEWFDHKGDVIRLDKLNHDIPYSVVKIYKEYVKKDKRSN